MLPDGEDLPSPEAGSITQETAEGMDVMDPQMFTVLAARVAIERLDTRDHECGKHPHRVRGSIARLTRLLTAAVTDRIASRRSPAGRIGALPVGGASDDRATTTGG